MTSEAPKEIWIEDEFGEGHEDQWSYGAWDCRNVYGYVISYTLTTHAQAMVAAEREACAALWVDVRVEGSFATTAVVAMSDRIRARTTADERAALDALLKAERVKGRVEGLREAAKWSCSIPTGVPEHYAQAVIDMNEHWKDAILALIEKETGQ